MELTNVKTKMKANWKKIALIGCGVILTGIGVVVLKNNTGKRPAIPKIELPRYHEDLCKQIKKTLGDKVYMDDVWAEKAGEINMILTDLSTKDIGELGAKFEQIGFNPDNTEIQVVLTLVNI